MQTTDKYNEIFKETKKLKPDDEVNSHQQQPSTVDKMDFNVLATEVSAIIKRAFETDEPKNIQS